jgi:hypothetical protein
MKDLVLELLDLHPDLIACVEVTDVDSDPDLMVRHGDEVPVLFIDGRKAFKYRVTAAALLARLGARS